MMQVYRCRLLGTCVQFETIGEQSSVYYGQKHPAMPKVPTPSLPSDCTMHQDVSRWLAAETELSFFKNILTCGDCPEYGGVNTNICREQGHALEPKTKIVYLALIELISENVGATYT